MGKCCTSGPLAASQRAGCETFLSSPLNSSLTFCLDTQQCSVRCCPTRGEKECGLYLKMQGCLLPTSTTIADSGRCPISLSGLLWRHRQGLRLGPASAGTGVEGRHISQDRAEGPQRVGRCGRPWQGSRRTGPGGGPATSFPKWSMAACHLPAPLPAWPRQRVWAERLGWFQRGCQKSPLPQNFG